MKRDGKFVFRPDSGNPIDIICGDEKAPTGTPANEGCLRLLDKMFGSTVNSKGYRVLNSKVGLIYGDGMYLERYHLTLQRMKDMGYSATNLIIGVGGILRNHSRDTLGFAIKATRVEVNGVEKSIMKDPITDKGKRSHKGYLRLERDSSGYHTLDDVSGESEKMGLLRPVFRDGKMLIDDDLYSMRDRVERSFKNVYA